MEEQQLCSVSGEKVNKCSSSQHVMTQIKPLPPDIRRIRNIDVETILTQIHGPAYQHLATQTNFHTLANTNQLSSKLTSKPAYQHSPTQTAQTNFHTLANTNQLSSKLTSKTDMPLSVSANQTNQPSPKSLQEMELHRNKKTLKAAIAKTSAKLQELHELELRASMSFLEVKKPVFECCEITHPINFLECLKLYLKRVPNEKKIDTILECLEGDAKDWAGALKEYWSGIEDFNKSFMEKYWGKSLQNVLRSKIFNGKYIDEVEDGSMSNYFLNIVAQARWLPHKIPDGDLIYQIMHHFPKRVQIGWYSTALNQERTVLEAVEFLRKMDEIEILSNIEKKYQKSKYKLCVRENSSKDCVINLNMKMKKKREAIQESISKVISIREGIKVAETASSKISTSQQQKQCTYSAYNEKVLKAIVKVNNLTKEIDHVEEDIKSNLNNFRRPDFISPNFSHPLNFLEDLQEYLKKIPSEYRTVENIVDCLNGDAHSWATIFKTRWSNFEYFKKDFLEQYWGSAEQTLLRREIVCGDWDIKYENMTQHLTRLITQAKFVTWPIPDEELVFDIMRHFSKHVQVSWRSSGQSSILEATAFLQKIDEEMDVEMKITQIQSKNILQDNMTELRNDTENISYIGERRVALDTINKLNNCKENNNVAQSQSPSTPMLSNDQQQTKWNEVEKKLNEIAEFVRQECENTKKKKIKRLTNTKTRLTTKAVGHRISESGVNPRAPRTTTSQITK